MISRFILVALGVFYCLTPGVLGLAEPWRKDEMTTASGRPVNPQTACLVGDSGLCQSEFVLKIAQSKFEHTTLLRPGPALSAALESGARLKVWYDYRKCQKRGCSVLALESGGRMILPYRSSSNFEWLLVLFCLIGATACFSMAQELSPAARNRRARAQARAMRRRLEPPMSEQTKSARPCRLEPSLD